jgi:hypothetical protein
MVHLQEKVNYSKNTNRHYRTLALFSMVFKCSDSFIKAAFETSFMHFFSSSLVYRRLTLYHSIKAIAGEKLNMGTDSFNRWGKREKY